VSRESPPPDQNTVRLTPGPRTDLDRRLDACEVARNRGLRASLFVPLRILVLLTMVAIAAYSTVARANADTGCSDREFLASLDKLQDWNALYAFVKRNLPACPDDGMYGEGYSEAVVTAFAKHWSHLPQLISILTRDPSFEAFALRHINETADPQALEETRQNAIHRCPPDTEGLCSKIAARAGKAIAEPAWLAPRTSAHVPGGVALVVLKKLIDDAGSSVVLCLEVGTADAPPTLIAKLRRDDRTIVAGSQCTPAEGSVKPSFHTSTHRAAHFLYVYNPKWLAPHSLRVQAENYYHGLWAIYWTVELLEANGQWQITMFREDGES
jgi:hypothetical protein